VTQRCEPELGRELGVVRPDAPDEPIEHVVRRLRDGEHRDDGRGQHRVRELAAGAEQLGSIVPHEPIPQRLLADGERDEQSVVRREDDRPRPHSAEHRAHARTSAGEPHEREVRHAVQEHVRHREHAVVVEPHDADVPVQRGQQHERDEQRVAMAATAQGDAPHDERDEHRDFGDERERADRLRHTREHVALEEPREPARQVGVPPQHRCDRAGPHGGLDEPAIGSRLAGLAHVQQREADVLHHEVEDRDVREHRPERLRRLEVQQESEPAHEQRRRDQSPPMQATRDRIEVRPVQRGPDVGDVDEQDRHDPHRGRHGIARPVPERDREPADRGDEPRCHEPPDIEAWRDDRGHARGHGRPW